MVIAAVDDLLFSSKIRHVARQVGVEVVFARSPEAVRTEVANRAPSLVVVDLDSARVAPVESIRHLKADPATHGVRVVGFVSHVHAARIDEARAAGADGIFARSAFTAHLADILSGRL